jgi:hypothetical protein
MKGGKRTGAGRPAIAPELKKKSISLKIPTWLNEWLDEQEESKVSLIEKALFAQYHLTPPDIQPDWFDGLSVRNIDGLKRLELYSLPKVKKLVNDPNFSFDTSSNMGKKSKLEIKAHIDGLAL